MTILYYLAKYWYVVVIASLVCLLVWNNSEHNKKYMKLKELMNRINDYHKARVKYVVGAWLKEYKD